MRIEKVGGMATGGIPHRSALAIIGAGPVGLEAAAWAARAGWDFAVFEKGEVGDNLLKWAHVQLFSPFRMNHSPWGMELLRRFDPGYHPPEEEAILSADEHRRRYLLPLSELPQLSSRIYCGVRVAEVGKAGLAKRDAIGDSSRLNRPFRLLLELEDGEAVHLCHALIDASGVYGNPQFLGEGNIPALGERRIRQQAPDRIHYRLVDVAGNARGEFQGKTTMVVGAGHSAATHLEALSQLAHEDKSTRVIWVCRSRKQPVYTLYPDDPLPDRDRLSRLANRLAQAPPPWLRFVAGSSVHRMNLIEEGGAERIEVDLSTDQGPQRFVVDQILASVGFGPDNRIYRQLQVHECYATQGPIKLAGALVGGSSDCLAQPAQGAELLENPEPGFFILGNKSYGTTSTFLLRHGIEQVEQVMGKLQQLFETQTAAGSGSPGSAL